MPKNKPKTETPKDPAAEEDEAARRAKNFQGRVERVLAVMTKERVDWRGVPYISPEGRIGTRVVPIDRVTEPQ